jgi:Na+/H+ antiporter
LAGFETILALLLASTALAVFARRVNVPVPIMMVIGGLAVALIPGLRLVEIDPDLAFTLFVPPLLFRAAITTSVRGLKANLRPVLMLAVGLVCVTALVVGIVAHFTSSLGWEESFVLGSIVAPPDAVVALALAHTLQLPRRTVTILEGETLLNDTTAFVLYRLAVRAAMTGEFDWKMAIPRFFLVGIGGAVVGYLIHVIVRWMGRYLKDPILENVVWLLTPFAAYLPAEALGASGVLAVVVSGILLRRASSLTISAKTRTQANDVYDVVEHVLNTLIFVLIGLQLGAIFRDPSSPPLATMLRQTVIVAGVVMLVRIVWMFLSAYGGRVLSKKGSSPPIRNIVLLSWIGMRGGDSLVTALALPDGVKGRELIVSVTFGVILATLLMQGLTLASLVRVLHFPTDHSQDAEEALARRHMTAAGDAHLATVAEQGEVPHHVVERVRRRHVERSEQQIDLNDEADKKVAELAREVERALIDARRRSVVQLQRDGVIDDAVLRMIERELDLEELALEDED